MGPFHMRLRDGSRQRSWNHIAMRIACATVRESMVPVWSMGQFYVMQAGAH
jgi:hypothetical protein